MHESFINSKNIYLEISYNIYLKKLSSCLLRENDIKKDRVVQKILCFRVTSCF